MVKYYQKYHDIVFMDATYNSNKQNLALVFISSVSSEGKNIVLGVGLLARETTEHYQWFLRKMVEFAGGIEPDTFMTDFDSSMCGAIESTFKNTTHFLCQWHMMLNFKKNFMFLSKRKNAYAKTTYNHIMDTIFTENPSRFQELQDIIFSTPDQLSDTNYNYLRGIFQIKEKWSTCHQPNIFTAGIHTISRAESTNSMIKHRLKGQKPLKELLMVIMEVERKVIETTIEEHKGRVVFRIHNPLLKNLC